MKWLKKGRNRKEAVVWWRHSRIWGQLWMIIYKINHELKFLQSSGLIYHVIIMTVSKIVPFYTSFKSYFYFLNFFCNDFPHCPCCTIGALCMAIDTVFWVASGWWLGMMMYCTICWRTICFAVGFRGWGGFVSVVSLPWWSSFVIAWLFQCVAYSFCRNLSFKNMFNIRSKSLNENCFFMHCRMIYLFAIHETKYFMLFN